MIEYDSEQSSNCKTKHVTCCNVCSVLGVRYQMFTYLNLVLLAATERPSILAKLPKRKVSRTSKEKFQRLPAGLQRPLFIAVHT